MTKIIGHEEAQGILKKLLPNNQVFLLLGPSGVGKRLVARKYAESLATPCDISEYVGFLSVETVRDVIEQSLLRPFGSSRKVFIISCERWSPEAMNAFLKLLEEPPGYVSIFLVTAARLPETIVSRCQVVKFSPLSGEEIVEVLTQSGMGYSTAVKYAGAGSVGGALAKRANEEHEMRVGTFFDAVGRGDMELVLKLALDWEDLDDFCLRERVCGREGNVKLNSRLAGLLLQGANPKLKMVLVADSLMRGRG